METDATETSDLWLITSFLTYIFESTVSYHCFKHQTQDSFIFVVAVGFWKGSHIPRCSAAVLYHRPYSLALRSLSSDKSLLSSDLNYGGAEVLLCCFSPVIPSAPSISVFNLR